ncbi:HAD-IIIC family phosphatase [Aliivibrio sp. S2TY2]|uniref:HAD-IIIC family phosphatase n=1 Tax=unclassified Aliivibrio TaxID=2645654 RepID=UPI002379DF50|nr:MULTISPECIES: HAD-IIIC family phosphatase [unclassified Aliivibrio]MDD9174928.1 HAD-IIIC family phosphatase [Aliivibrio sp. S3TY1]MDD9192125.1 HAD-IIIC family phosphatase [Aliivibrio sp. S2TY2]
MNDFFLEPLSNVELIRNRNKIKEKYLPLATNKIKLLILNGSTVGELKEFIYLFLLQHGIESEIFESTYNSYYEDVMFGSIIEDINPDWVYIHTTNKNIYHWPMPNMTDEEIDLLYSNEVDKIKNIYNRLEEKGVYTIVNNYEMPIERVYGNYDFVSNSGFCNYINKVNYFISEELGKKENIFINDIMYLSSLVGLNFWFNESYWYSFKYAISPAALPNVAKSIANIIKSVYGKSKKVLVCDLDNTLWGGVIGDDGKDGILIGQGNGKAEAFLDVQKYIHRLKLRGVILAVNSKNDITLAKEGFNNTYSQLIVDDFSSFVANWDMKSSNMKRIEEELNLFQDSFVFIDDNPAEIEQVKSSCSFVSCISYEKSPHEILRKIDRDGYFETVKLSKEDLIRTNLYSKNKKIKELENNASSFDDYLLSLNMKSLLSPLNKSNISRVEQLINKTNQFNPTTMRVSSADILDYMNNSTTISLVGSLQDVYGDNGIVTSLVACVNKAIANIDIWVMSCRVFNRELDFALFDQFIVFCKERNIEEVHAKYLKSSKNAYVQNLYERLGFIVIDAKEDSKIYVLNVSEYVSKNKAIEVNYEH